jgi:mono/diheme cytochrome c family protein
MSPGRVRRPVAVVALVALVGACGSDEPQSGTSSSADPVRGAEVYAAGCASCHGADLRGTDKGPSHLSIVYEPSHHGDASFRNAIANGSPQHHWEFGDMEPVEGLSDGDVEAVIAFVRAEQERLGFEG